MPELFLCNGCEREMPRVDNCTYCGVEICEKCCGDEHYECRECSQFTEEE